MSSSRRFLAALAVAVCFGLVACADFSRGPESPAVDAGSDVGEGGSADGAPVSFAVSVHPLLIASCQHCHSTGAETGDTQLLFTGDAAADYVAVSRLVETSAPAGSRLLSKASGDGHDGGTVFAVGSPEYQTVLQWIQQGARP